MLRVGVGVVESCCTTRFGVFWTFKQCGGGGTAGGTGVNDPIGGVHDRAGGSGFAPMGLIFFGVFCLIRCKGGGQLGGQGLGGVLDRAGGVHDRVGGSGVASLASIFSCVFFSSSGIARLTSRYLPAWISTNPEGSLPINCSTTLSS